jgi:hypothetical protein
LIFGAYGGQVYCTDGEWVLVKKPVQGNYPLYWYTRSHYNNWDFGQVNYPEDSKARLDQWDGVRFPTQYPRAHPGHAAPKLIRSDEELRAELPFPEDELFHAATDHGQQHNVAKEQSEAVERLKQLMSERMQAVHAPDEQWERLGLGKSAKTYA